MKNTPQPPEGYQPLRDGEIIRAQEHRIAELEAWIKAEGEHNDTCTYHILKKVCNGCRCERRDKK